MTTIKTTQEYIMIGTNIIFLISGLVMNTLTVIVLRKLIAKDCSATFRILLFMLAICDYFKLFAYVIITTYMLQLAIKGVAWLPEIYGSVLLTMLAVSDYGFTVFITLISIYRYCFVCSKYGYQIFFATKKRFVFVISLCWLFIVIGIATNLSMIHCERSNNSSAIDIKSNNIARTWHAVMVKVYYVSSHTILLSVPIFCFLTWKKLQTWRTLGCSGQQIARKAEMVFVLQVAFIWFCYYIFYFTYYILYKSFTKESSAIHLIQVVLNSMYLLMNMVHPYIYLFSDRYFRKEMCKLLHLKKNTQLIQLIN